MTAKVPELDALSRTLGQNGVAGFCPTTLSTNPEDLRKSLETLGKWIRRGLHPGAIPLGIHLEGPFIHPGACGAHPKDQTRKFTWKEFQSLWMASQGTLKILTLAPEQIRPADLTQLVGFAKKQKIRLSLGHSKASQKDAEKAFNQGFTSVTHAWNAMSFHHREPGIMGAALGNPDVWLELILDQVHVSPTVIDWTRQLHPLQKICFISDCIAPAGLKEGTWSQFGPLKVIQKEGACRLKEGHLAGGSRLLPVAYEAWIQATSQRLATSPTLLRKATLGCITTHPLGLLNLSPDALYQKNGCISG